jgi:hypothetical protein
MANDALHMKIHKNGMAAGLVNGKTAVTVLVNTFPHGPTDNSHAKVFFDMLVKSECSDVKMRRVINSGLINKLFIYVNGDDVVTYVIDKCPEKR